MAELGIKGMMQQLFGGADNYPLAFAQLESVGLLVCEDEGVTVNFVDSNNRLIGYRLGQDCCEEATWRILWLTPKVAIAPAFSCVRERRRMSFYPQVVFADERSVDTCPLFDEDLDGGELRAWTLVHARSRKPVAYLMCANNHNGWYGHGFSDFKDGELFDKGVL